MLTDLLLEPCEAVTPLLTPAGLVVNPEVVVEVDGDQPPRSHVLQDGGLELVSGLHPDDLVFGVDAVPVHRV